MAMLFSRDYVNDIHIYLFNAFFLPFLLNRFGHRYVGMDILCYIESVWPWHWPQSKTNIWEFPLYPSFTDILNKTTSTFDVEPKQGDCRHDGTW
jgi:hypothetical protein